VSAETFRVLSVASEIYPLVKTGGLADVTGGLPAALARLGVLVRTLVPGYPAVLTQLNTAEPALDLGDFFGGPARILAGHAYDLALFVLDAPHLFNRPGNPYVGPGGEDWPDNAFRFAALARAGADIAVGRLSGFRPDLVHVHDWQAALTPAYLQYKSNGARPRIVITVHNLAFQGQFDPALLAALGLPPGSFAIDGVEYYGGIGFLKAGLLFADRITTVSPTYAAEIRTPEFGMGLDGLLRTRSAVLSGILNGIDDAVWNPAADEMIAVRYDCETASARAANKVALQARLGLAAAPDTPTFGVVSRLSWQKGIDLVLAALPMLLAEGAQIVLLGSGERVLEQGMLAAAAAHPGQVSVVIGYNEELAHQIQAGADALIVPSRFEPCGLTQLCALRYGAVPVVSRAGGLSDSVIDANEMAVMAGVATGVQFQPVIPDMLEAAIHRTAALYRDRAAWQTMQRNGMRCDVSWRASARRYAALYREAVREAA
jgi:starch synthase